MFSFQLTIILFLGETNEYFCTVSVHPLIKSLITTNQQVFKCVRNSVNIDIKMEILLLLSLTNILRALSSSNTMLLTLLITTRYVYLLDLTHIEICGPESFSFWPVHVLNYMNLIRTIMLRADPFKWYKLMMTKSYFSWSTLSTIKPSSSRLCI